MKRPGNALSVGQFESLLWETRASRVGRRPRPQGTAQLRASPLAEWTAQPVGRLGRPLVAEIERYLEFFALAQTGDDGPEAQ